MTRSDHDDRLDPDSVIVADSETMLRQRLKRKARYICSYNDVVMAWDLFLIQQRIGP